jgi:hypothetical protein
MSTPDSSQTPMSSIDHPQMESFEEDYEEVDSSQPHFTASPSNFYPHFYGKQDGNMLGECFIVEDGDASHCEQEESIVEEELVHDHNEDSHETGDEFDYELGSPTYEVRPNFNFHINLNNLLEIL